MPKSSTASGLPWRTSSGTSTSRCWTTACLLPRRQRRSSGCTSATVSYRTRAEVSPSGSGELALVLLTQQVLLHLAHGVARQLDNAGIHVLRNILHPIT